MYGAAMALTMMIKDVSPEDAEEIAKGGEPLRTLCRKEVDCFDAYLRAVGGDYKEGLARFERFAVEGYLYQKLRGHFDAYAEEGHLPAEGQDGSPTSS
jgi:hypothetical protein